MQDDRATVRTGAAQGEHPLLREGLLAGLIGALVVAAWFFLLDLFQGRLLFTPAALGSAFFLGVDDPAGVQTTAATVLGYTVLHIALFAAAGLLLAGLFRKADEHPSIILALALLFVTFETLVLGLIAILAAWLVDVLTWWSITVANLIAAAAMGWFLWKRHPGIADDFEHAEDPVPTAATGRPPR